MGQRRHIYCIFIYYFFYLLPPSLPSNSNRPSIKETKFLLPKPALSARDVKPPQWVNMVQASWEEVGALSAGKAKAEVLQVLAKWPLFGSSFFAVRRLH